MEASLPHPQIPRKSVTPIHILDIPQVSQVEPVRREGELWHIRAQAGLSVATIIAVDIFFHFFYILTIPSDLKFASRLPDSALGGCTGDPEQGWGPGHHPRKIDLYSYADRLVFLWCHHWGKLTP